ncbi:uncharacterized protein RG961_014921 [Leptosomus discolor]
MARKMQVLLPPVMEVLQDGDADIEREVLVVFRNVMGHLERKEASPIALQLAERLPPLFNEESSQTRELSISLLRDVLETVVGDDRRRMKKKAQRGLLPLFFHLHDGADTVAKAEIPKLAGRADPPGERQGQELLAGRCWECVSPLAPTAQDTEDRAELPSVPARVPPRPSSSPSASCCGGGRAGGVPSQLRSLRSALLPRSP